MTARRDAHGKVLRGTSNTNSRGSAHERRKRKCWTLSWFGDGISCLCFLCGRVLLYSTLQIDRIIPEILGGTYARGNIRPACGECNRHAGNLVKRWLREGVRRREIIRRCRLGDFPWP